MKYYSILAKLLRTWRDDLNKWPRKPSACKFTPLTAITDTDLKERGALLLVFPEIWLLICHFHLKQSWKNHRVKMIKGSDAAAGDLKGRMQKLECTIIAAESAATARALCDEERELLEAHALEDESHAPAITKAIAHIDYLRNYWSTDNLWQSWSDYGRTVAAQRLGKAVDNVLPTTNHLESFNRVLKHIHLKRYKNGGRRLRIDILIHSLITDILPSIFFERRLQLEETTRMNALILLLPGGAALLGSNVAAAPVPTIPRVAYLVPDAEREARAQDLMSWNQLSAPQVLPGNIGLAFTVYSSCALHGAVNPVIYTIRVGFNGVITCTCPDFVERGGACKHIRAVLISLAIRRQEGIPIPPIPIPNSLQTARELQQSLLTIKLPPRLADLPTHQASRRIDDLLRDDELTEPILPSMTGVKDGGAEKAPDSEDSEDDDEVSSKPLVCGFFLLFFFLPLFSLLHFTASSRFAREHCTQ